jgi:phosphate transport system permease protein
MMKNESNNNSLLNSKMKLTKRLHLSEFFAEYTIKAVSFTSFAVIILIFIFVFREALPTFSQREKSTLTTKDLQQETYGEDPSTTKNNQSGIEKRNNTSISMETSGSEGKVTLESLAGKEWQPVSSNPRYGILPLFWGSFKVTFIAILIGAPLAILAALFSALFAPKILKETIKPTIELLAGFPSVVIGFFALVTIASISQKFFGYQFRLNAFVGGVALSLAVIPIVYTVTEDAINSIPKYLSEAALALGATKWQTALFVILPAATPGVFAALLLGFGRAFGETMIVLMATGNAALLSINPFEPVRTMSATIGAEMAEVVFGETHYTVLFLIGTLLFIFTFILNAVAEFYVRTKLMKRFRGE